MNLARRFAAQLRANPIRTLGLAAIVSTEKALVLATKAAMAFAAVGAGALVAFGTKAILVASETEQLRVAFEVLLGTADKAARRMADLQHFANVTPFELTEVANASRSLEVLTRGALSGVKGLTLIGDVASAVLRPFDEIAVTIGRLYDAIRSGSAAGQELARLQELGAITGPGRKKIESLEAAGLTVDAWKLAEKELMRFSGMMEKQSRTWKGVWSTFRDSIFAAFRAVGEPLIEALKPFMTEFTEKVFALGPTLKSFATILANFIKGGLDLLLEFFNNPGKTIKKWGNYLLDVLKTVMMKLGGFFVQGILAMAPALGTMLGIAPAPAPPSKPDIGLESDETGSAFAMARPPRTAKFEKEAEHGLNAFGRRIFSKFASSIPVEEPYSAHIKTHNHFTKGAYGLNTASNSSSFRPDGGIGHFAGPLAQGARRTTSLLGWRERREVDMARRAGIMAHNDGRRPAGDTLVRRGDRARMLELQREKLREKMGLDKTNDILAQIQKRFDELTR